MASAVQATAVAPERAQRREQVPKRPASLAGLTGLRFWAACGVAIHHYCLAFALPIFPLVAPPHLGWLWRAITSLMLNANVGVTFFFVLSGFILTHTAAEPDGTAMRLSMKRFYVARFARIGSCRSRRSC